MPKDSKSGRGKVSLLLCAVTVLTTSVIFAVGMFSSTSRTKELFGFGSDERPHRGRTLLSVLKNRTLSGNVSRERVDKLWGRFLEKVKKAVGRVAFSTTTATATSGSRRSSTASKTSRPAVTSTKDAAESTSKDARFGDNETATVDYGRDDEYTTPGGANASERLRRMPNSDGRRTSVTKPEDEIAEFNHDNGFESNSSFRGTTSHSDEVASSYMGPLSPTVAPGTVLAIVDEDHPAHRGTFRTDSSLPEWKSNQAVPNASTTRPGKTRGLENSAEEGVNEKHFVEVSGPDDTWRSEHFENSSNGSTVDSSSVRERRQGLVAADTSYGRDALKPREALDLVKAHVETGSAIYRDGVDGIGERLPAPSVSDIVRTSSNLSAVETMVPAQLPQRRLAAEGQRLFVSDAVFSFSDRKEGSLDIGPDSSVAAIQPNRNSTGEVSEVKANAMWSGRLSGADSSLVSEHDTRKTTTGIERLVGTSNWQGLERIPEVTADGEELPLPTKNAKYKGSIHSNSYPGDARGSEHSETGSLPNVNHTNASDTSVGSSSVYSSSPVSDDEQRPLAHLKVDDSSLSTPRKNDEAKPVNSWTYVSEISVGDEGGQEHVAPGGVELLPPNKTAKYRVSNRHPNGSLANSRSSGHSVTTGAFRDSSGQLFVSETLERVEASSTGGAKELSSSGVSHDTGVRIESGRSSARTATELNEGPLLEIRATNSESPRALSTVRWPKGPGRYRMTDNTGVGTEPFQEVVQSEESATLAANKAPSRVVLTLYSQVDDLRGSTLEATDSRETELFDLSRELDRIAHEFTDFLESKAKDSQGPSSGGRASTSVGLEEPFRADEEGATVAERDAAPAASTSVVVTVEEHIGDSTSDDAASSTFSQAREEEFSENLDEETRPNTEQATSELVTDVRMKSEGGQIYCSVGPAYTGPLPPALCSYFLVYSGVLYNSNRKSFQVVSKGSWLALVSKANRPKMGPRILLVLSASHVQNMVADFPVPAVFATKAQSFIETQGLWGLSFDLSLTTDYDARSHAMLLRETKSSMPEYHFVGLMDFFAASGLLRANLAVLVGSVHKVFLRHDPQRVYTIGTSVPNPFASPNRRSYSVENAMRLAESLRLVSPDHNQVCLSVSLAVYKFNIYMLDANYSSPGVGSLAFSADTGFSYSELCKNYKGLHTHFDDASLSTYVHKGSAWLGFDDDTSMEIKIDKLSRGHRVGCLLADHIDLDDFTNVCKKGDFPRLRLLRRAFSSRE